MSLFACEKCNCIENTALSNYWQDAYLYKKEVLCSECDPQIGKWHNRFEKRDYRDEYQLCPNEVMRIICPKPNGWDYCRHGKAKECEP